MSADRVAAVVGALVRPDPYRGCTHPNDAGRYVGPCPVCDALAVVAALDRYDREHMDALGAQAHAAAESARTLPRRWAR